MTSTKHLITEPCGATWTAHATGLMHRAFWVSVHGGVPSRAMPNVVGFYAASIEVARRRLHATDSACKA